MIGAFLQRIPLKVMLRGDCFTVTLKWRTEIKTLFLCFFCFLLYMYWFNIQYPSFVGFVCFLVKLFMYNILKFYLLKETIACSNWEWNVVCFLKEVYSCLQFSSTIESMYDQGGYMTSLVWCRMTAFALSKNKKYISCLLMKPNQFN